MKKTILGACLLLLASSSSNAGMTSWMEQYFEEMVVSITENLAEAGRISSDEEEIEGFNGWRFKGFDFRVRPQAGFEIPQIITLTIVPELELRFER